MGNSKTLWGVHMPANHGTAPIDNGYIGIGWTDMGDLSPLPADREAFKTKLAATYPQKKKGAIPVDAGTLYRFVHEMAIGDIVVYPSKNDRMVNIGEVTGQYQYIQEGKTLDSPNRRAIKWHQHLPRTVFSQGALHEIGSFITLFQITTHADEFYSALRGERHEPEESDDADVEAASDQVEESTEDFVIRRLKTALTAERFEHFVAHLLRCMGYQARVTQYSSDGGIDIIAHRDELGFEPPVIKVQCKQVVNNIDRPDVQKLKGAVEPGEFGLFVTLGSYSRGALDEERSRPNLRLLDGAMLTELIFRHYDKFEPQWQTVIPLKRRYIPGPVKSD